MYKKINLFTSLFIVILLFASASLEKSSSGAPPSHTGAPDEQTCTTKGCHDDHALNSGEARLDLQLDQGEANIEAGKTYTVKIKISDKNVSRFGFQLLALTEKNKENAGRFKIIDSVRTQLLQNRYALKDRTYLTYTFNGTDAVKPGEGEWLVKWVAPENLNEAVVFYLAGVSGNDDMTDKGDHTYTSAYTFKNKNR